MMLPGVGINLLKETDFSAVHAQWTYHLPQYIYILYGIGKKRLQNVKDAYNRNGLEVRIHKNTKSLPHNCFFSQNFKRFLNNYAEENAILLPGRIPGYKRDDISAAATRK